MRKKKKPSLNAELEWGLVIDGKDADKGEKAYDGEGFEKHRLEALPYTLALDTTGTLQMEVVMKMAQLGGLPEFRFGCCPLMDYLPTCMRALDCKSRAAAIADLSEEFVKTTKDDGGCVNDTTTVPYPGTTQSALTRLVEDYAEKSSWLLSRPSSDEGSKLKLLATFLRKFAWLHPFSDHNGRVRTLILQLELRRFDLGCAMMYNNNRDVFFMSLGTYVEKIREGIHMCSLAIKTGKNPWLLPAEKKKHLDRFGALKCDAGAPPGWGSVNIAKPTNSSSS